MLFIHLVVYSVFRMELNLDNTVGYLDSMLSFIHLNTMPFAVEFALSVYSRLRSTHGVVCYHILSVGPFTVPSFTVPLFTVPLVGIKSSHQTCSFLLSISIFQSNPSSSRNQAFESEQSSLLH